MPNSLSKGPIGVFDSGVGGLSVLRALWKTLPGERFYYVADNHNCPYGEREPTEIQAFALGLGTFLADAGAKAIVVACNAASAAALPALRAHLRDIPVVGMVPALKPAAKLTRQGIIGVLATEATIAGALYQDVLARLAPDMRVISQACPGLVECIERGDLEGPQTETLLRTCLAPIMAAQADILVLGCTHYPFVMPLLARILGPDVVLMEPSDAIAQQTRRVLDRRGSLADRVSSQCPETVFASTGNAGVFGRSLRNLLGIDHDILSLRWERGQLKRVTPSHDLMFSCS